uniref:Uncharacterized protein n=1 Tax=Cacopsylla melanoneura TaxID=428564 RepID=A0A8D8LCF5_9HEMI
MPRARFQTIFLIIKILHSLLRIKVNSPNILPPNTQISTVSTPPHHITRLSHSRLHTIHNCFPISRISHSPLSPDSPRFRNSLHLMLSMINSYSQGPTLCLIPVDSQYEGGPILNLLLIKRGALHSIKQ